MSMINRNLSQDEKTKQFIEKANKKHNGFYSYEKTIYTKTKEKVIITCPIHGDFEKDPNKHLNRKQGCPECSKNNRLSKGEQEVLKYLTENNIDFVKEYKYTKSKYLKNKPFDFFVERSNLLIEFQGEQHYKKKFNMSDEDLKERIKIDKLKEKYAKHYGFNYLTISYKDNIRDKLDTIFSSTTIETTP